MPFLAVQQLDKTYQGEKIIDQLSFSIEKGIKLGIAGETGAAKTTLLKIVAGLLQPDGGQVLLDGVKIKGPEEQLLPGHPAIGFVSQHFELRNNYRVEEELEMASKLDPQETAHIVSICKIDHLLKRKTTALSGGERQRIVLAKTLLKKPSLLLLDEPFSNLDPAHKNQMKEVLDELTTAFSLTMILVSHDGSDLLSWADHLLLLQKGKIIQQGTPATVYYRPLNHYAAGLLGPFTSIDENDPIELVQLFSKSGVANFPIIVRPAQLATSSQPKEGVLGIIQQSFFMGGYWLVQVLVDKKLICVQAVEKPSSAGVSVWLTATHSV